MVTVLRVLCLGPVEAGVAACMETHLEDWRSRDDFAKYGLVVRYLQDTLQLGVEENKVLAIIASSFTNDFSLSTAEGGEVHCLLPLTAMLNHSCFPNISRSIRKLPDGRFLMRVLAARPIKKGEQIFNSYTDMLDPVQVRRAALQEAKNLACRCVRCEDPRDLGSYGNAVLCPACRGALLPPPGCRGDFWTCEQCPKTVASPMVDALVHSLDKEQKAALADPETKTVRTLEKLIKKWGKRLDPRNLLVVRLKYNLLALYGRQRGFSQAEMTEELWARKRELCEEVAESLKVLEPGMTVRKARLLQELHLPILMLAQVNTLVDGQTDI